MFGFPDIVARKETRRNNTESKRWPPVDRDFIRDVTAMHRWDITLFQLKNVFRIITRMKLTIPKYIWIDIISKL